MPGGISLPIGKKIAPRKPHGSVRPPRGAFALFGADAQALLQADRRKGEGVTILREGDGLAVGVQGADRADAAGRERLQLQRTGA